MTRLQMQYGWPERVAYGAGVAWRWAYRGVRRGVAYGGRYAREGFRQQHVTVRDRWRQRRARPQPARGRRGAPRRRPARKPKTTRIPCPNAVRGCKYQQNGPGAAEMLWHLRNECKHVRPKAGRRRGPAPRGQGGPGRGGPGRGGPGRGGPGRGGAGGSSAATIGQRINDLVAQMGPHMDQMRAAAKTLRAAGEFEPETLHELLDGFVGLQAIVAATAEVITDLADFADTEMWVDLAALRYAWEAADEVLAAVPLLGRASDTVSHLYAGRLAAEEEAADSNGARPLNPQRLKPVA